VVTHEHCFWYSMKVNRARRRRAMVAADSARLFRSTHTTEAAPSRRRPARARTRARELLLALSSGTTRAWWVPPPSSSPGPSYVRGRRVCVFRVINHSRSRQATHHARSPLIMVIKGGRGWRSCGFCTLRSCEQDKLSREGKW
jgi:hypothetical protein